MSLSDKSKSPKSSPVELYIEWSGSKGLFQYYDRNLKENIVFEDDIYIIPLDILVTVRGFNEPSNSGVTANEIRNQLTDVLNVKSFKGGDIATGVWSNISDKVGNNGGNYSKSVYAALLSAGKYRLVNIQFYSSAIGPFIDAKVDIDSGQPLKLSPSTTKLQKGATTYYSPGVKKMKKREDVIEKSIELDIELQKYLDSYFLVQTEKEIIEEVIEEVKEEKPKEEVKEIDPLEAAFNASMQEETIKQEEEKKEDEFEDIDDLPF